MELGGETFGLTFPAISTGKTLKTNPGKCRILTAPTDTPNPTGSLKTPRASTPKRGLIKLQSSLAALI
jgi:hypothetical protein